MFLSRNDDSLGNRLSCWKLLIMMGDTYLKILWLVKCVYHLTRRDLVDLFCQLNSFLVFQYWYWILKVLISNRETRKPIQRLEILLHICYAFMVEFLPSILNRVQGNWNLALLSMCMGAIHLRRSSHCDKFHVIGPTFWFIYVLITAHIAIWPVDPLDLSHCPACFIIHLNLLILRVSQEFLQVVTRSKLFLMDWLLNHYVACLIVSMAVF